MSTEWRRNPTLVLLCLSADSSDGADELRLNRFLISCCPGDAVNVSVRVVNAPTGQFKEDDWIRVTGKVYPIEKPDGQRHEDDC
jgi:uncharacterized membrane protein YcgQ (UPF0703/DUF1980 family)